MAARRRKSSVFTNRKASVSVHRNGLSIEIGDVPAVDAGVVAKELLDIVRQLWTAGYDELTLDRGALHGGVIEVPEEYDGEDYVIPPEAKRRIGFHA
jgi:hypothetical protein